MGNIDARLDRLSICSLHRAAVIALAFAYFFDFTNLFTFSYAAPGIIKNWHINVHTIGAILSIGFLGMFIGAITGGRLADRLGRKRALIWSISIYSIFTIVTAFAWDVRSLEFLRFCTGIGLASMTVSANTYIGELFPARDRGKYTGLIITFAALATLVTALVARGVTPIAPWAWRIVFLWGGMGIFAIFFTRKIIESPRWYSSRGYVAEAEELTVKLENLAIKENGPLPEAGVLEEPIVSLQNGYSELFKKSQRGRTIMLMFLWSFQTNGFYGFAAWVPTLLVQHGFSVVRSLSFSLIIAASAPVGAFLASQMIERIDRKWFITIGSMFIAILGTIYGLTVVPIFIIIFGFLVGVGIQTSTVALYVYTPELFPTRLRASGHGLTFSVGRLAAIFGPLIIAYVFSSFGYAAAFSFVGGCWLACSVIVGLFGPLTTGLSLSALNK